jgi:hypothetical protein
LSRRRIAASLLSALVVLGASACSSGDDTPSSTPSDDAGDRSARDAAQAMTGNDGDRAFGVDREAIGSALKSATRADDVRIEGDTIELVYEEGSAESASAHVNCTAGLALIADEDRLALVYPDGRIDCDDL